MLLHELYSNEQVVIITWSDRPQVIINQTDHRWRLGTLERPWNINENRKDIIVLFLLIVVLFGFLNIKSVQIYNDNTDQVIITTCSLEYSSCNSIRTLYEEMDIKTITQTHFVHTRFRKPNKTTINKNKTIISFRFSFIFQGLSSVPSLHLWSVWFMITCGRFVCCLCVLREYIYIKSLTNFIMLCTFPWLGFELNTWVVIDTCCIGSG
jgi:hypothetical protein